MATELERALTEAAEWERRRRPAPRPKPPTLDDLDVGSDLLIVVGRLPARLAHGVRRAGYHLIFDETNQQRWWRPAHARPEATSS